MLASLKVETFSPRYQDTPNSNALHKRETTDEMIRTLPYFSSLSLFFLRQINRFLPPSPPDWSVGLEHDRAKRRRRGAEPLLPFSFTHLL